VPSHAASKELGGCALQLLDCVPFGAEELDDALFADEVSGPDDD
jgi:hypothetical protein